MRDIFYFTDIHGRYDLYKTVMKYCHGQDPEAMIIYGGDACDRGPDGYKIMKKLLKNPKVLYLKGNHEDMFVHAAWEILRDYHGSLNENAVWEYLYQFEFGDNWASDSIGLCMYNGGFSTIKDWMTDGMPEEFVDKINDLPVTFSYEDLDFCHAGGIYAAFERASRAEYDGDWIDKDDLLMLLWDRDHLLVEWAPDRTCIFGHTPVFYYPSSCYGKDKSLANAHPCAYGRKIDMDTGAVASNRIFVLNCLTMKAQGFDGKRKIGEIKF